VGFAYQGSQYTQARSFALDSRHRRLRLPIPRRPPPRCDPIKLYVWVLPRVSPHARRRSALPSAPQAILRALGWISSNNKSADFGRTQNRPVALTGLAAAWRYAPVTRYARTQAYWDGNPDELARALDLKETSTGANVQLLRPRDAGVL